MYHKNSLFVLIVIISTTWSPMIHPGKNDKKEKKSSSLKKSDRVSFTAYERLNACQQALQKSIESKGLYLQAYPDASEHTSSQLCSLIGAIYEKQAAFLQARQEAEAQRDFMLSIKNNEAYKLLVRALSTSSKTLLYRANEQRENTLDPTLTRGATIPQFSKPRNRRQSVPLSMLSSGAASPSNKSSSSNEAPLGAAPENQYGQVPQRTSFAVTRRSVTTEALPPDTSHETQYARTPSFSAASEENLQEKTYGKIPIHIPE